MSTFGPNSAYINELYYEYLKNPGTFSESWQTFFSNYHPDANGDLETISTGVGSSVGSVEPQKAPSPGSNGSSVAEPSLPSATNGLPANEKRREEAPTPPASATVTPSQPASPTPVAEKKESVSPPPAGGVKLSGIPLRIAQNMEQSLTLPTATSFREIPVKLMEENRRLINGYLSASDQGKVSFTHLIGWGIVKAMAHYPNMNNAFDQVGDTSYLVEHPDVNLGLAIDVAKPGGGRSLVVPSIKKANQMTFSQYYDEYENLVHKGREGKLEIDDFAGTTITLTNPGTIGTIASVPRLMKGQGAIIATGAINYPSAYLGMNAETLNELGISKVMQMTSTYDHRIIQGAESGLFLAKLQELLTGGEDFYTDIFRALKIPYRPLEWHRDTHRSRFGMNGTHEAIMLQQKVLRMINSFRVRGHLQAHINPLGEDLHYHPDLDPATYDLTIWDFDRIFMTGGLAGTEEADLRTILSVLRDTYTQRIGVEYMHIQDWDRKYWLQDLMETSRNQPNLSQAEKLRILRKLSQAELFEKFLQTKYTGHKRFSLEGAESLIPMLDELIHKAGEFGGKEVLVGMAHRGRLNVLVNILGKSAQTIFAEFEEGAATTELDRSGDVPYHTGAAGVSIAEGRTVELYLAPNPSHLEAVDPIIEGMARARQDKVNSEESVNQYIPVLIHGDAAFAGQGVVAETLNMSQLKGYHTGGTIHIVVNNQIGFTASPEDTYSGVYSTDVARMVQAPIFHVNGDDPESVIQVMRLAFEYRRKFRQDVVIDMFCYRRHGHNESDEPSYTNPVLYSKIKDHPSVRHVYTERLVRNGTMTKEKADEIEVKFKDELEALLEATKAQPKVSDPEDPLAEQRINPKETWSNPTTRIPEFTFDHIAKHLATVPTEIEVHPKLGRLIENRTKQIEDGKIDWALAEAFAFGSLALEGYPIRLSGQDSQRGTFSQRHAVLHDQNSHRTWSQLDNLSETQSRVNVYDSPLSEYAVLGFEYGYSSADPKSLVLWEAQFGDFVNGAQIIIDQFISSGEDKWNQASGVVLLLPHAFEGQGPEHSSARLERFLTLCAEDNMRVVVPTTPAQYFHMLRKQAKREIRKPLIVFTPKSLLRHKLAISTRDEFLHGDFMEVIPEIDAIDPKKVRRILFCSGKVYYDLLEGRREREINDVAIIRVEKLYPFPDKEIREQLELYHQATDVQWVQEEPKNAGAWPAVAHWLKGVLLESQQLSFLGRPASGSPATGSKYQHKLEQGEIVKRALVF
ncbi:MAG: multifunctional oxoglutarate decarboxylase/oxoglutarate dehydrogenase thiamine pyrophosphate-binding subunit/dihydrolipoyllysine-residue succinyltransferase subunit [Candidatus Kapaibacterium sp.]